MDSSSSLEGSYTETFPIDGRTTLSFLRGKIMVETDNRDGNSDIFYYKVENDKLILTPTWDTTSSWELNVEIINSKEFKIENMYPGILEITYPEMIFRK